MKKLLADAEMAQTIGAAGRMEVIQRFSIDRFTNNWNDLFNYMIANHKNIPHEKKYSLHQ